MLSDIRQHEYIDPSLRSLLQWIEETTGLTFTITSQYRQGDDGVHGTIPLRGTDLRMRNARIGTVIQDYINEYWVYDASRPEKKCCKLHGEGANLHLHIQVHPSTEFNP